MKMRRMLAGLAAFVLVAAGFISAGPAHATVDVYGTPGTHLVNGRYWDTTCSMYSSNVVRCTTNIFGTRVLSESGRWYKQNGWVFNNLSYLPSGRAQWGANPLAVTGSWVATDGRQWRTECDTPATGRGACRNYVVADVASETGGLVKTQRLEVFNSMLRFSTSTLPPVSEIPPPGVSVAAPAAGAKVPLRAPVATPVPKPSVPTAPPASGGAAPIGSSCPSTHPIKGNHSSSGEWIYHVPGGSFYNRTNPEECFATEAAAQAAGYRKALR